MTTEIESTGTLERKVAISVPKAEIEKEISQRLRKLSKTVKMPGFRPGKVPMKMIEQSYGAQVNGEVLGDAVSKAFNDIVQESELRVAGQPNIDGREGAPETEFGFTATFEVYPDIPAVDPSGLSVSRGSCDVGDAEIERTIDILRKQRVTWKATEGAAAEQDQVTIDFVGRLDGELFDGGSAEDFAFVLGAGRMLSDFETGVTGKKSGETVTFPVAFPDDYSAKDLAGKTAEFEVTLKKLESPELPEVNADFAKQLGVSDGSLDTMRSDIRANLEREVAQRVAARNKSKVMDALKDSVAFDLPKVLLDSERDSLVERAKQDLISRGMKVDDVPIPTDVFNDQAESRVRLGLLVSEVVKNNQLQAKPDQIKVQIEQLAQAYENPAEVIRHYFSDRERLAEIEALVIEQNVVDWALAKAKVTDEQIDFEELMGAQ